MRHEIFICRKAGLVCGSFDKDDLKEFARKRGVKPKGMSLKELVFVGSDKTRIGAIDADTMCLLGALVYKGSKASISLMQIGETKKINYFRGYVAEDVRDYMLICLAVYLEEMGLDRSLKDELYNQIVNIESCTDGTSGKRRYRLFGNFEAKLSIRDKMNDIYKSSRRLNPHIKTLLIIIASVFLAMLLRWLSEPR